MSPEPLTDTDVRLLLRQLVASVDRLEQRLVLVLSLLAAGNVAAGILDLEPVRSVLTATLGR